MTTTAEQAAPARWTEADMKSALWRHYVSRGWAVLTEVSLTDGDEKYARDRRIDVLCVRRAKRMGIGPIELLAIEVKVSRADFLSDVRRPEKQAPWRELAHRHAYAVPDGLVRPEEVPGGSFLITADREKPGWDQLTVPTSRLEVKVPTIPPRMFVGLVYRLSTAEANAKGLNPHVGQHGDPEEMRAKIEQLTNALGVAESARRRAQDLARDWRTYAKGLTGAPCGTCGHEVRATNRDRHGYDGFVWRHTDRTLEPACAEKRREDERQQRLRMARINHDSHPQMYPPVDPDTFELGYYRDAGPRPAFNDDEEIPTDE